MKSIKEEWVSGARSDQNNDYREVFKNSFRSEVLDIQEFGGLRYGDSVRFIAIKDSKDVYVTSGDVFHISIVDAVEELKSGNYEYYILFNFSGMGDITRGKKSLLQMIFQIGWWMSQRNYIIGARK